ncbi:hypothetical protein, partial [Pseudomonas sp. SIMBA_068]|uniref:hypothetical protein n=1 Tax=Pseudomonas sp. SIMBA_068 TaxID=3085808 RepID=UPI00397D8E83
EFVVPMSLEVGRIIRGFGRASTFNFSYLEYSWRRPYQGPPGVRHNTFSAYEIERRPRGASQHKAAPTFVSGQ